MRLIWEHHRKARISHWCDCCCDSIEPGEEYEAQVWDAGGGRLTVFKQHANPCCDPPPEPWDEEEDSFSDLGLEDELADEAA